MPFTHTRLARLDAIGIAYRLCGSGTPVLLLHPVGLDSRCWLPFATRLASDFRVLAPDLRGHGESTRITAEVELADLADDIGALLRTLGFPRVHVVGLSMGGMVAQHLALRHPDRVRSLSLLGTACTISDEARSGVAERGEVARLEGMRAVVESTLSRWFTASVLGSPLAESCRQKLLQTDAQSWAWCWHAISRLDTLSMLGTIAVPTLVETGTLDVSAPPAAASLLAQSIPNAHLEVLDGVPHMGAFESPDTCLAPVVAFLHRNNRTDA